MSYYINNGTFGIYYENIEDVPEGYKPIECEIGSQDSFMDSSSDEKPKDSIEELLDAIIFE